MNATRAAAYGAARDQALQRRNGASPAVTSGIVRRPVPEKWMPPRLGDDPEFRATLKLALVAAAAIAVGAAGWLLWLLH